VCQHDVGLAGPGKQPPHRSITADRHEHAPVGTRACQVRQPLIPIGRRDIQRGRIHALAVQ
jgi:hypothetical protein